MRRALALLLGSLLTTAAQAAIYENTVDINDEEDIFNAAQRGDISEETRDTLLELFREGVDLNNATRDQLYDLPSLTYENVDALLEYRTSRGTVADPAELVGVGVITAEQLLEIAPFVLITEAGTPLPVSGRAHLISMAALSDTVAPPALLTARVKAPFDIQAGLMVVTSRLQPASPHYDTLTDSLVSNGLGYQVHFPRLFVGWLSGKRKVILGTYTIGFAERLVLDNTRRTTPNGLYLVDDYTRSAELASGCRAPDGTPGSIGGECDTTNGNHYETADFGRRDVFRGVAGSIEDLPLGNDMDLSLYGFLSYQSRSIYQYDIYDRRVCVDPTDPNDSACASPPVYLNDPGNPGTTTLRYTTLPYLYDELAGGGHVDLEPRPGSHIGLTGYGAAPFWDNAFHYTAPMRLDFKPSARYPRGGPYGAVGLNGRTAWEEFNFFVEAARSFDSKGAGGGWGVEQRSTWSPRGHEVELSLRYYDLNFANPYARPIAGPDEFEGQRASNELGARLRYLGKLNRDWQLRTRLDFWVQPFATAAGPGGLANLDTRVRGDFTGWEFFAPSLWFNMRQSGLSAAAQSTVCSDTSFTGTDLVGIDTCGDSYTIGLRLGSDLLRKKLHLALQGTLAWREDPRYTDRLRNDVTGWAEARYKLLETFRLRWTALYRFEDVSDNRYLKQYLSNRLEFSWAPKTRTRLSARYEAFLWLDDRDSTKERIPYPLEHRFLLDLAVAF